MMDPIYVMIFAGGFIVGCLFAAIVDWEEKVKGGKP
jgi:hypothetical protein